MRRLRTQTAQSKLCPRASKGFENRYGRGMRLGVAMLMSTCLPPRAFNNSMPSPWISRMARRSPCVSLPYPASLVAPRCPFQTLLKSLLLQQIELPGMERALCERQYWISPGNRSRFTNRPERLYKRT